MAKPWISKAAKITVHFVLFWPPYPAHHFHLDITRFDESNVRILKRYEVGVDAVPPSPPLVPKY